MTKKIDNLSTLPDSGQIIFSSLLIALTSPLALIPLEKILPYPYFFEEFFKAWLVFFILKLASKELQLKTTLLAGLLFASSENVLYLTNFITASAIISFWQRIPITTTLHILTMIIILLPGQRNRLFIPPATILTMIIHFFYNQIVLSVF